MYDGNDITGREVELSTIKFRKVITGKSVVGTHGVREPEEDSAAVSLANWLGLPGIEEIPL